MRAAERTMHRFPLQFVRQSSLLRSLQRQIGSSRPSIAAMMVMKKKSSPKHRHDGTSPLPLGMDWSPPPKRWSGRETVWPHDPHTGWSYCVTIPSWIVLPESKMSGGGSANPIVFYRVQIGVQSPEGFSNARGILRRFSDFLKLHTALKSAFPMKSLPPPPPKHSFLRINSSRPLLEERRYALEEWMHKLLSDIDLSRSVPVASFLELEAAARSSFQDTNQHNLDGHPPGGVSASLPFQNNLVLSVSGGSSSNASKGPSSALDYGSDNVCETSEIGTPRHERDSSDIGTEDLFLDQDLAGPTGRDTVYGNAAKDLFLSRETLEFVSESDKLAGHGRKNSSESVGSDLSSIRGSELSNAGATNMHGHNSNGIGGAEVSGEICGSMEFQFLNDVHVVLPLDQRNKMSRVLTTMQRRLATAKTDMEDLIARLNQEIAVKEYLTTKVKDLDVELESTKQKSKENLQQAILAERERVTQMQWDMEELRRKCLEMESKLKLDQDEKIHSEFAKMSALHEKEQLLQELDVAKEKLKNLQKHHEDLEVKSKADVKVLVKEVKSLRKTQTDLKQELSQSLKEKAELERILQKEKQRREKASSARVKLLHECEILRHRLQECSVNFLTEEEDKFTVDSSSLLDALDLLTTSDNRIGLLLAEAQLLARDDESSAAAGEDRMQVNANANGDDPRVKDDEIRKMLADTLIDNARLHKQVNSTLRFALKKVVNPEKEDSEEAPSRKTVLNKFLER